MERQPTHPLSPETVRAGNFDYGTRFEHGGKVLEVRGNEMVEVEI